MGPHRGKGLIDFLVDHNPFNLTLPGLNYCGPGNDLKSQIARNISPTNPLDNACRAHDIAYENSTDSSVRRVADQKLLDAALERIKSSQSSFLEKVGAATVAAAMKGKMMLGGKLGRRKSGQLKRLQVRSMPALGRRKRRGGKRRSIPSRATLAKRGIVMPGAYVARRGIDEKLIFPSGAYDMNSIFTKIKEFLERQKEKLAAGERVFLNEIFTAADCVLSWELIPTSGRVALKSNLEIDFSIPHSIGPNLGTSSTLDFTSGDMEDILNVDQVPQFDDRIESFSWYHYQPFNSSALSYNDEIRIAINQADVITAPHLSFLQIEGRVSKGTATAFPNLVSLPFGHLFENVSYKLNGQEIEFIRTPGIVSTLKTLVCSTPSDLPRLENSGFNNPNDDDEGVTAPSSITKDIGAARHFSACVPLRLFFGFFEDVKKVLINTSQELVLMRASNDYNVFKGGADNSASTLILDKISWVVPQVKLSDEERAKLYNSLTRDPTFFLPFRCHELHEYPQLPSSSKISWNVKVSTQIHKPRYLIVALYTKLRNEITGSMTLPSVTNLRNAKLYLNDEAFPLQDMQFDLKNGKVAELYEAYARFQNSFYDRDNSQPILNRGTFADHPIIVIDMSRQRESVKTGAVDVRLELESIDNFPANTICYALLFHDKIVSYGPLNGTVKVY
ncbi:hypothetical protein GE061_003842 [Apolygus lucorum]|uniref:Capsid protein n=1 Tax=Apolygus lucorum TaxID=248454 RepID=A0A8S9X395_APOLU|nr:hypothetical protein GE061_003842 [Apolygus lucorum]